MTKNGIDEKTKSRTAKRRLAQWLETWLIELTTSHQLLRCIDSFVLRNRQLLKPTKRYAKPVGGIATSNSVQERNNVLIRIFLTN